MFDPPYGLWSIWRQLPTLHRLFFVVLCFVGVYIIFSGVAVCVQLRAIVAESSADSNRSIPRTLIHLRHRCTNMRQLLEACFVLFFVTLFFGLERIAWILADGKMPLGFLVLENFIRDCAFACNTCSIFLVLYLFQWFVSWRVLRIIQIT